MNDKVVPIKQPFTSQMEEMLRHARKIKPDTMLIALYCGGEDPHVYVDWSYGTMDTLIMLRALIDNQIEQAAFRRNMKYSFCPPDFSDNIYGPDDDPDDIA